jgi:hypothetical protein
MQELPQITGGLMLIGCAIGPNYSREPAPVPTHYKELRLEPCSTER